MDDLTGFGGMVLEVYTLNRFDWLINKIDPNAKIVDIGCGDATLWKIHGLYGKENIVLVDIDLYDHPNFVRADAHNLPFKDKSFDIALLCEILEHVEDPVQVLREAKRVASRILITVPDEANWISLYRPYTPIWEEIILHGCKDIRDHARKSNPDVKEFYSDLTHLHHIRHYDEKLLREHLELAGVENYDVIRLLYNGWAFFAVEVRDST